MSVVLVTDRPAHQRFYESQRIPVMFGGDTRIKGKRGAVRIDHASVMRPNGPRNFVRSLHQLGSPFVDLRSFSLPFDVTPLRPVYGAGTDRSFLRTSIFSGRGRLIHRDDPQILVNYQRICSGAEGGPIGWIRPGFPALVHLSDWHVDGKKIRGALASSVDRPGGFVVLEPEDLVRVMGYEPTVSVSEADLVGLLPYECLCRLLDWAESVLSPGDELRASSFEPRPSIH